MEFVIQLADINPTRLTFYNLLTTATTCRIFNLRQVVAVIIRGARPMKNLGRLSETEMEVMEVIWEIATSATVNRLLDIFESKGWKTSTLSTLLKRLIEKGFLTKSMSGKVNYYVPALTLSEYKKYETQSFLSRLYNGKAKNFIAALVDDAELSHDDIAELKEWFARKDGNK